MGKDEILFKKETLDGEYQLVKEKDADFKKIIMQFIKNGKSKILWEIKVTNNKIQVVKPFFGIRLKSSSTDKNKTFIDIPRQFEEMEKMSYPAFMRGFLADKSSSTTSAWLNLNGKRKNLGYFGKEGPGFVGYTVHKELLKVLSEELGIKIRQTE